MMNKLTQKQQRYFEDKVVMWGDGRHSGEDALGESSTYKKLDYNNIFSIEVDEQGDFLFSQGGVDKYYQLTLSNLEVLELAEELVSMVKENNA